MLYGLCDTCSQRMHLTREQLLFMRGWQVQTEYVATVCNVILLKLGHAVVEGLCLAGSGFGASVVSLCESAVVVVRCSFCLCMFSYVCV